MYCIHRLREIKFDSHSLSFGPNVFCTYIPRFLASVTACLDLPESKRERLRARPLLIIDNNPTIGTQTNRYADCDSQSVVMVRVHTIDVGGSRLKFRLWPRYRRRYQSTLTHHCCARKEHALAVVLRQTEFKHHSHSQAGTPVFQMYPSPDTRHSERGFDVLTWMNTMVRPSEEHTG